jgi:hypothetical protein
MQTEPVQIRRRDGKSAYPVSPVGFDEKLNSSGVELIPLKSKRSGQRRETLQSGVQTLSRRRKPETH